MKSSQKKKGRKSVWSEESINEVVDLICENDCYRKMLIFINDKETKNSEIYEKVLKYVQNRLASRNSKFPFTIAQMRIKFRVFQFAKKYPCRGKQPVALITLYIREAMVLGSRN